MKPDRKIEAPLESSINCKTNSLAKATQGVSSQMRPSIMYSWDALWSDHTARKNRRGECDRHENGTCVCFVQTRVFIIHHKIAECAVAWILSPPPQSFPCFARFLRLNKNISSFVRAALFAIFGHSPHYCINFINLI